MAFHFLPLPLPFLALAFIFLLPFFLIDHPLAKAFLIFAFFPLSIAWNSAYFSQYKFYPPCQGRGFVTGKVLEEASFSERGKADFLLKGEMIKTEGVEDREKTVRVFLSEKEGRGFKMGQNVKLVGDIIVPPLRTRLKGISYYLRSAKAIEVEDGRGFTALIGRLRYSLQEASHRLLPSDSSLILSSLVIGKTGFPPPAGIVEAFRKTGTIHILVVSGTQVSLLVAFIWFLLKALNIRAKGISSALLFVREEVRRKMGIKAKEEILLLLRGVLFFLSFSFIIIGYTRLVGGDLPIRRAAVMGILGTLAVILTRESDTFNIFALTALLILISYPPALYDPSFQLSFLAVWGLVAILPLISGLFPPPRSSSLRFFYLTFATSLAAQIAVAPLIIYRFKLISPIALIANVFAVPLSFVILIEGLCFLPLVLLLPFLGSIIAPLIYIPISALLKVVCFFSRLPLASLQISLPVYILYFYLFLLLLAGEIVATPSSRFMRKSFLFLFALFSLLLIGYNVL